MILCFIGMPCSGKGTIAKMVHAKLLDECRTAIIHTSDIINSIITQEDKDKMKAGGLFPRENELRANLAETIDNMYAFGAQAIILDGFPRFDDQVRWLRQTFYASPLEFFEVRAQSDFELQKRAGVRKRDEFDEPSLFMLRLATQKRTYATAEAMIQNYGLPYHTVMNVDQNIAVDNAMKWLDRKKLKTFIDTM